MKSEKIIDFFYAQKPKIVWECAEGLMNEIRRLQDANGQVLCYRSSVSGTFNQYTFLGYPIYFNWEFEGLTLKFIFVDGEEKRIRYLQ